MQNDLYKLKLELLQNVFNFYQDEYNQLSNKWRDLDTKAQGNLNISGVLITVNSFFVREINSNFPPDMRLILAIAISFLFLALSTAIASLMVKIKFYLFKAKYLEKMTVEILELPHEELFIRRLNLFQDQYKIWQLVLQANEEAYTLKSERLFVAQCFLLVSLLLLTIIVVRSIFWKI